MCYGSAAVMSLSHFTLDTVTETYLCITTAYVHACVELKGRHGAVFDWKTPQWLTWNAFRTTIASLCSPGTAIQVVPIKLICPYQSPPYVCGLPATSQ